MRLLKWQWPYRWTDFDKTVDGYYRLLPGDWTGISESVSNPTTPSPEDFKDTSLQPQIRLQLLWKHRRLLVCALQMENGSESRQGNTLIVSGDTSDERRS
jgi:hypothetical protein